MARARAYGQRVHPACSRLDRAHARTARTCTSALLVLARTGGRRRLWPSPPLPASTATGQLARVGRTTQGAYFQWVTEDKITLFTSEGLVHIGGSLVPRHFPTSDTLLQNLLQRAYTSDPSGSLSLLQDLLLSHKGLQLSGQQTTYLRLLSPTLRLRGQPYLRSTKDPTSELCSAPTLSDPQATYLNLISKAYSSGFSALQLQAQGSTLRVLQHSYSSVPNRYLPQCPSKHLQLSDKLVTYLRPKGPTLRSTLGSYLSTPQGTYLSD
ncbi:hypothetical protein KSP39_PZI013046 [Platanthera zijinensis]|uniref:Uncharacterized protein n=1 Tax=Platanthera zijinensis TaxID=2320716 RepID=A0AAP0BDZ0_9ASPA